MECAGRQRCCITTTNKRSCARLVPRRHNAITGSPGGSTMKYTLLALAMLLSGPALAQSVPEINFDSVPDYPKLPKGMNFGEVPGVAVNSRGHVYVFTRSNSANGPAYAPAAAQLLEFDQNGEFVGEIGKGLYGWSFAHTVRVDREDNIWAVDKGSDMIIKFNPAG